MDGKRWIEWLKIGTSHMKEIFSCVINSTGKRMNYDKFAYLFVFGPFLRKKLDSCSWYLVSPNGILVGSYLPSACKNKINFINKFEEALYFN